MRTVSTHEVATGEQVVEGLPERVQEALGELAGAAKEGLLALSVGVGLGVLAEIMEGEVDEVVGPKGKHDPDRAAKRHGHEDGAVTLGGRRALIRRPRVRSTDDEHELALATYRHFADRDPLTEVVLERMLAGVSTRHYRRAGEPVGAEVENASRSLSKSAVSREFVSRTRGNLVELMSRPLGDLRLAALMLAGIELKGRCCVVALRSKPPNRAGGRPTLGTSSRARALQAEPPARRRHACLGKLLDVSGRLTALHGIEKPRQLPRTLCDAPSAERE